MATLTSNERTNTNLAPKNWELWTGRVLSALPVFLLLLSATMKLGHGAQFVSQWTGKFGWQESALTGVGLLELVCTAIYLVPRTSFFGAILLSAYLGGAVATHLRIGDPFVIPVTLGVMLWAGLTLRDGRIRAIVLGRRVAA
jgi:hypothetical protein